MKRKTKKMIHKGYGLEYLLDQLIEAIRVYAERCEDPNIHSPIQKNLNELNKLLEDYDKAIEDFKGFDYDNGNDEYYIKKFKNEMKTKEDLLIFIAKNNNAFWD